MIKIYTIFAAQLRNYVILWQSRMLRLILQIINYLESEFVNQCIAVSRGYNNGDLNYTDGSLTPYNEMYNNTR